MPRKHAPASGITSHSGSDRSPDNGYFRAKVVQEELIKGSGIPYTVIRSTQFMEFFGSIADAGQKDGIINIATGLFQPIAADDVAAFVADAALAAPRNGTIEIAGPERAPFDEIIRRYLRMMGDDRPVRADRGPLLRWKGRAIVSCTPRERRSLAESSSPIGSDENSRRELATPRSEEVRKHEDDDERVGALALVAATDVRADETVGNTVRLAELEGC